MCAYYDAQCGLIISAGPKVNIRIIYESFSSGDRCKTEARETDTEMRGLNRNLVVWKILHDLHVVSTLQLISWSFQLVKKG